MNEGTAPVRDAAGGIAGQGVSNVSGINRCRGFRRSQTARLPAPQVRAPTSLYCTLALTVKPQCGGSCPRGCGTLFRPQPIGLRIALRALRVVPRWARALRGSCSGAKRPVALHRRVRAGLRASKWRDGAGQARGGAPSAAAGRAGCKATPGRRREVGRSRCSLDMGRWRRRQTKGLRSKRLRICCAAARRCRSDFSTAM
jgi:hypothetical protein